MKNNLFDKLFRIFVIILPFYALISVFFQYKLGIKIFGIFKEVLLVILFGILIIELIKTKRSLKFDTLDYLIFGYFGYLLLISLINFNGIKAIIYGGRYDFEFLITFLIIPHGYFLLQNKISYYLKIFLISSSIAIIVGIIVRFVIGETILLNFGFSNKLSSWSIEAGPPIFHGIEGQNIRRFQGIFDGPNQAAYFLLVYLGLFFHYLRHKKNYELILIGGLFVVTGLIFMTYSRSSWLGFIGGIGIIIILNLKKIYKKYRKEFIGLTVIVGIMGLIFYVRYGGNMEGIILRAGSSKGHSERMIIGFKQFKEKPFGQGLASSGPAYRFAHNTINIDEKNYIPESWFVQQLVEGGIIGFCLFVCIILFIGYLISKISIGLLFSFSAVIVMNIFLHTFEASYISIILFSFLGLFLKAKQ